VLSIARVSLALQFQGDFILLRQFNFGMASLERVVRSLFDACDEGQKGIPRSVQATMIGLAKKSANPTVRTVS
jgi:hypothetical protein